MIGEQTQGPFGSFVVRIDPWAVEYGSETPTDFQGDPDDAATVDPSVERNVSAWGPVLPPPAALPDQLAIVDGVRRMEARLVVTEQGRLLHGLQPAARTSIASWTLCWSKPRPSAGLSINGSCTARTRSNA